MSNDEPHRSAPNAMVGDKSRLVGSFHRRALEMGRPKKQALFMLADAVAVVFCLFVAMAFRYGRIDFPDRNTLTWLLLVLPIAGVAIYWSLGLYNVVMRAMESRTISIIAGGAIMLALFVAAASYMDDELHIPKTVPPIFGILVFVAIGLIRVLARAYHQYVSAHLFIRENVLIYGAGAAGTQLAATIQSGNHYRLVGFLDDDPRLLGSMIRGCRVYSPDRVGKLVHRFHLRRILFALASASPAQRRNIVARLAPMQLELQTIPALSDILRGRADVQQLQEIQIEDLLGRTTVSPIPELFDAAIDGKRIMVTGAGGSIGSELCRQILKARPEKLVLLELSELALYNVERKIREQLGADTSVEITFALGDIRDRSRVRTLLKRHSINVVYHAAAYKHVPIVESNPSQGVTNNIFGTLAVAEESAAHGVERFILISTDKAVRPSNVMGASKRLAELVVQDIQSRTANTVFTIVRFGNVLGSSGSVLHLFTEQIRDGGPVTVTHKDVTRYFMTIQEAAELVIQAGSMAGGGEVFVLDMGEPIKIQDLAELMISLSGKALRDESQPEGDIQIDYIGLRPGEKMFEELLITDSVVGTQHPKIMRADEKKQTSTASMQDLIMQLERNLKSGDPRQLLQTLQDAVEGYKPHPIAEEISGRTSPRNNAKVLSLEEMRALRQKGH